MESYDLLLKNGTLIDPSSGIQAAMDVAFANGLVAACNPDINPSMSRRTIDCQGAYVVPGMIDMHVHTYWGVSHYGIERPDACCIARGATTIIDPGSAGADTFNGFRKYVVDQLDTRAFALINVSCLGMISFDFGEAVLPAALSIEKALETIEAHRDVIVGVKVRLGEESQGPERDAGLKALDIARNIADRSGLLLMVHPLDAYCDNLDDILNVLTAGDILTHTFHRYGCGILDENKRVREAVWNAQQKGIIFDVGHGMASFCWDVAEAAVAQGFWPDTISTDLHIYNQNGPVFDLVTTIGKFLHLGMPLEDAIKAVTLNPAQAIGKADFLGTLKNSAAGDAVVFSLEEGHFDLFDGTGEMVNGKWEFYNGTGKRRVAQRIMRVANVVKDGKLYVAKS